MSAFTEVMAEEWKAESCNLYLGRNDPDFPHVCQVTSGPEREDGSDIVGEFHSDDGSKPQHIGDFGPDAFDPKPIEDTRAAVAVLGKRALANMLAYESCDSCTSGDRCETHSIEYRVIVGEARRLGWTP